MATTALVDKTPLRAVTEVRFLLSNLQAGGQLKAVAAEHMSPERMMRLLALAIDKTPMIERCTPLSVLGALMTCASLGLEPNTVLNHAYIIPRKNGWKSKESRKNGGGDVYEATLQIGYRGYIQLGHNSGQIAGIDAGVHYDDDKHWKFMKGSKGVLEHEPGPEKGKKLHAYAVVSLTNGNSIWVVWPWEKVLAHRDRYSDAYRYATENGKLDSPWHTNEDAMAMKTMIRQVAKWMPMSSEIVRAASLDGARANYGDFAMNPYSGLPTPEDDSDSSEAEIVDSGDDGVAEVEEKTPAPAATQQRAAAPAARQQAAVNRPAPRAQAQTTPAPAGSLPTPQQIAQQKAKEAARAAKATGTPIPEQVKADLPPETKTKAQQPAAELDLDPQPQAQAVDPFPEDDDQDQRAAGDDDVQDNVHRRMAQTIMEDIDEGGASPDVILQSWEVQIAEIKEYDLELYNEIRIHAGLDAENATE